MNYFYLFILSVFLISQGLWAGSDPVPNNTNCGQGGQSRKFKKCLKIQQKKRSSYGPAVLTAGSYEGTQNGTVPVSLFLKPVPGREGSFFALLMKNKKGDKVSLYIVDTLKTASYAMTPMEITEDGEIGIVNDDPSLVLNVSNEQGYITFKIINSGSSNNNGFKGYMTFNGRKCESEWVGLYEGDYSLGSDSDALSISSFDTTEGEAVATILTKSNSGSYTIREKLPFMFLINRNITSSIGTKTNKIPKSIGVFVSWCHHGCRLKLIMVDPHNDTNLTQYQLI